MTDSDPIQTATETCADSIRQKLGAKCPSFLAVHFLCGGLDKPGFIRKSAVRLDDGFLAKLGLTGDDKEPPSNQTHRDVLRRHVRAFERKETLLTIALIAKAKKKAKGNFWYRVGAAIPPKLPGWEEDSLTWPDNLEEFLVPGKKAMTYLQRAYANPGTSLSAEALHEFDMQRAETFGRWLIEIKGAGAEKKEEVWNYLTPLQSSLIYFRVASTLDAKAVSGDFLVFKLKLKMTASRKSPIESVAVVVLSPPIAGVEWVDSIGVDVRDSFVIPEVVNHLGGHEGLKEILPKLIFSLRPSDTEKLPKNVQDKILEAGKILPVPGHHDRFQLLTLWLALLTKKLTGRVHEEEALEFWFVAGDLSEFEDDPDVLFDKRFKAVDEQAQFSPPADIDKLEDHAETAAKLLEKEHFPWFEGGRYALFFDLASKNMRAVGLCGIKRSTWSHLFTEVYKSEAEQKQDNSGVKIPMCIIGLVSTRHGGTTIGLCHPQATKGKHLKHLLRLRDGKWQFAEDKRHSELVKLLKEVAAPATVAQRQSLAELCVLIADNPHAGGTVVLMKNRAAFKKFLQMGTPWDFGQQLFSSEKSPLMAHDGATLVYFNREKQRFDFDYRYILTPDGIADKVKEQLIAISKRFDKESPLAGVGTRRWSAALAAFKKEVDTVIVISQDGDITYWRVPDKTHYNSATITKLPLGGKRLKKKFKYYLL